MPLLPDITSKIHIFDISSGKIVKTSQVNCILNMHRGYFDIIEEADI